MTGSSNISTSDLLRLANESSEELLGISVVFIKHLGMPLHADKKSVARKLDSLAYSVRRQRRDGKTVSYTLNRLMVVAVY